MAIKTNAKTKTPDLTKVVVPDWGDIDNWKVHPVAELFPMLSETELKVLAEDIRENGLRNVLVFDLRGRLIDGRNRLAAIRLLGDEWIEANSHKCGGVYVSDNPEATEAELEAELVRYILSTNLHRRHLNESQRAMVAAEIANVTHGGDRKSDQSADLHLDPIKVEDAAEMLNVSPRSVKSAKKVKASGDEKLIAEVKAGKVKVSKAESLVKEKAKPKPKPKAPAQPRTQKAATKAEPETTPDAKPAEVTDPKDLEKVQRLLRSYDGLPQMLRYTFWNLIRHEFEGEGQ